MKAAYIFFGQVKNFSNRQFNAFKKNVQDKLAGYDIDYFLITSRSEEYYNPRQLESEGGRCKINHRSIQKYFDFRCIFYDELDTIEQGEIDDLANNLVNNFGGTWDDDSLLSTKNSLKQLYSLQYFYDQFEKCNFEYDVYFMSRSDLFHTQDLKTQYLDHNVDLIAPYFEDYPEIQYGWFGGINDRFAVINNKRTLKVYCSRYNAIKQQPQKYHAETFLLQQLKRNNISYGKLPSFNFRLIRANNKITDLIGITIDEHISSNLNNISDAYFINLERRKDRLEHIKQNLRFYADRFEAVDAQTAELNDEVKKLFPKDYLERPKAEICCAISHYRLWQKLAQDEDAENYLVMEDDVVFKPAFKEFWNDAFSKQFPANSLVTYLGGCQPWNKPYYNEVLKRYNNYFYTVKKNDHFSKGDHYWQMNAHSYILSKEAAKLMCDWVERHGMNCALDHFILNFFTKRKEHFAPHRIYHLNPLMTYQLHEENDNTELDKKSDLRFAKDTFGDDSKKELDPEKIFVPKKTNLTKFRCGKNHDGGYVLLKEIFDKIDIVYSYGIDDSEDSDCFDVECANDGKQVFMFDGTIDRASETHPLMNFKKENVTGDNFIGHVFQNRHGSEKNMLLKMDIEGCEYEVIQNNLKFIAQHFEMLCIEFHGINNPEYYNFENKMEVVDSILEYYDIFHMHANNWVARNFTVPNVLEVSFVRKGSCSDQLDEAYPVAGLDFPNCTDRDDYILDWWTKKKIDFPFLQELKSKQITKKIHISWKDENVITSDQPLIQKGIANLLKLNPGWEMEIYNDEDINKMLRDSIGIDNWNLIKDKKITEKTDLWRLLKTYQEGGLYVDIDRYIDTPISEIIDEKTLCVLPTFMDVDFSQDFILTCPRNPVIGQAIGNNLKYRRQGKNLFFLAVCSYMHSVSQVLSGRTVERGINEKYFQDIRNKINDCEHMQTYRELGPENHILFRNKDGQFSMQQFEKDKADFYNSYNVCHWNDQTQEKHNAIKVNDTNKTKLIFIQEDLFEEDYICELFEDMNCEKVYDPSLKMIEQNSVIVYSDIFAKNLNVYPESERATLENRQVKFAEYFEKFKNKNCVLVHLSDEHCHAAIDHYKYFKHVFRQYYRKDAKLNNVSFIPLGYKKGFKK